MESAGLPFTLTSDGPLTDVALLKARIEPIIMKHLDQWYDLDDSIGPIA